ncbi:hypothetical protein V5O48_019385, partial [Marasmius crinis-equi]
LFTTGSPLTNHVKSCEERHRIDAENRRLRQQQQGSSRGAVGSLQGQGPTHSPMMYPDLIEELPLFYRDYDDDDEAIATDIPDTDPPDSTEQDPSSDDILVDFHPSSLREREHTAFEDFGVEVAEDPEPYDKVPWRPFLSRFDYEVADLALRAYLDQEQVQTLFRLLEEARNGAELHMKSYAQLQAMWDAAADRTTR